MKKILLAALIAGGVAYGAPVASACHTINPLNPACWIHANYAGPGCDTNGVNDTTPGGQLGGENQWNGEASVLVIATDSTGVPTPTAQISVDCEMIINGNSQGVFLHADGIGVAANAGQFSFTALDTDVVTVCTNVTVDGNFFQDCADLTFTQIVPQPVVDAINMVIDFLNDNVFSQIDPTICPVIAAAAPGVAGVVDISPEGDVAILTEPFWDCPPYTEEV